MIDNYALGMFFAIMSGVMNALGAILQIPTQIVPILIYFMVYQQHTTGITLLYIPLGVLMIITSGFLLGKLKVE